MRQVAPASYWPPDLAMMAVDSVHSMTGMPYWMTIMAITLGIRTAILPIGLLAARNGARTAAMKPEMDALQAAIKVCACDTHTRFLCFFLRLLLFRLLACVCVCVGGRCWWRRAVVLLVPSCEQSWRRGVVFVLPPLEDAHTFLRHQCGPSTAHVRELLQQRPPTNGRTNFLLHEKPEKNVAYVGRTRVR